MARDKGLHVYAVDPALLDADVAALQGVTHIKKVAEVSYGSLLNHSGGRPAHLRILSVLRHSASSYSGHDPDTVTTVGAELSLSWFRWCHCSSCRTESGQSN